MVCFKSSYQDVVDWVDKCSDLNSKIQIECKITFQLIAECAVTIFGGVAVPWHSQGAIVQDWSDMDLLSYRINIGVKSN